MELLAIAVIGTGIGFLGGLFGKGGSAVATPLLAAVGVPPVVAVAAPLPATIPSAATAGWTYWRAGLLDRRTTLATIGFGVPATIAGALASDLVDPSSLVLATELLVLAFGVRFALGRAEAAGATTADPPALAVIAAVAVVVGVISGLLANSGGFLLAPLFVTALRLPLKTAFASSLAVATVLAIPGTVVHAALGHIDWTLVAVFASTSVPLSRLGARVAIRSRVAVLERAYGVALVALSAYFLLG